MINPIKLFFKVWLGILPWIDISVAWILTKLEHKELLPAVSSNQEESNNAQSPGNSTQNGTGVKRIKLLMEFTVGPGPNDVELNCASTISQDQPRFFLIRWTISVLTSVIMVNEIVTRVLRKFAGIEALENTQSLPPVRYTRSSLKTEDGRAKRSPRRRLSNQKKNFGLPSSIPLKILNLLGITEPHLLPPVFEIPHDLILDANAEQRQRKSEVPKRKHSEAETESSTNADSTGGSDVEEKSGEGAEDSLIFGKETSPNPPMKNNASDNLHNGKHESLYRKHLNLALIGNGDLDYNSAEDSDYEPTAEELNMSSSTVETNSSVTHSEIEDLTQGDLSIPPTNGNGELESNFDPLVVVTEEDPKSGDPAAIVMPNGNKKKRQSTSTLSCIFEEEPEDNNCEKDNISISTTSSTNTSPFSFHSSYYSPMHSPHSELESPPIGETPPPPPGWETESLSLSGFHPNNQTKPTPETNLSSSSPLFHNLTM